MSPAELLPKFFLVSSVILMVSGVGQVLVRPRKEKETLAERLVNRATLTAVISVVIGIGGVLLGLGVLPLPRFK